MFGAAPGGSHIMPHTPDGGSPSLFNLAGQHAAAQSAATGGVGATAGGGTGNNSGTIEQIKAGISNISNLFPDIAGPISREVEDEANSYFQRIYNHPPHPTLTIDEVLQLLKKFQVRGCVIAEHIVASRARYERMALNAEYCLYWQSDTKTC
jgi:hypothetical protein